MKKLKLILRMALIAVAMAIFCNNSIFAQGDILDLCPTAQGQSNCMTSPAVNIPFNFDATGGDSIMVIDNISGRRVLNPTVADKQYKFCAPVDHPSICPGLGSYGADGEFHLRFTDDLGNHIDNIYKVTFRILNPISGIITVTSYQGGVGSVVAASTIPGGGKYTGLNTDSFVVISGYDGDITLESQLFILDSVKIFYPDINHCPTDITLSPSSIDENQLPNTFVGRFTTADPDAGDIHTYSLVSGTGDADNASFHISNDTLYSSAMFDYETKSSYSIRVQTDDGECSTYEEQFTIAVNDVTEIANFTITTIANTSVNENTAYTSVTPALSGDTPVGGIAYSLGGTDAGGFTINTTTGVVEMVARNYESPVDGNTDNVYEVSITATDEDGNSDTEEWTVAVNDVIETTAITINEVANDTIIEDTPYSNPAPGITGTPIGNVIYSLEGADASNFSVNASTGAVNMVARDYEAPADANADNVYEATLRATDDDGNTDTESWTVAVTSLCQDAYALFNDSIATLNAIIAAKELEIASLQDSINKYKNLWKSDTINCNANDTSGTTITIIEVSASTGVSGPLSSLGIRFYPNPGIDCFTIESDVTITHIQVYDLQGQLKTESTPNNLSATINTKGMLTDGIYIIKVERGVGVITLKAVVASGK